MDSDDDLHEDDSFCRHIMYMITEINDDILNNQL